MAEKEAQKAQILDIVTDRAIDAVDRLSLKEKQKLKATKDLQANLIILREFWQLDSKEDQSLSILKRQALERAMTEVANEYAAQGITRQIIKGWITGVESVTTTQVKPAQPAVIKPKKAQLESGPVNQEKAILSPDLIQYFGLGNTELRTMQELKKEFGFEFSSCLSRYKTYIEKELQLPVGSKLPAEKHKKLIANIKKIITLKFSSFPTIINEVKKKNAGSLKNMQWIINEELVASLQDVSGALFASAKFYINMYDPRFKQAFLTRAEKVHFLKSNAIEILRNIENLLINGNITSGKTPVGILGRSAFLASTLDIKALGVSDIPSINQSLKQAQMVETSFLSEKDREIEDNVMTYYLAAIGLQIVGATISLPIDITDIFSSKDATLIFLKKLKLIPANYEMSKGLSDHIFALLGVVSATGSIQVLGKSKKIAKMLPRFGRFNLKRFSKALETLVSKLNIGIDENIIKKVIRWVAGSDEAHAVERGSDLARPTSVAAVKPKTLPRRPAHPEEIAIAKAALRSNKEKLSDPLLVMKEVGPERVRPASVTAVKPKTLPRRPAHPEEIAIAKAALRSNKEKLSDPLLAIKERVDIIKKLPRKTKEQRTFIAQEIAKTRELVESARETIVDFVEKVESALTYCSNRGIPANQWFKTKYGDEAFELLDSLPSDIQKVVMERYNLLQDDLIRQSRYADMSPSELAHLYFDYLPLGDFRVNVSPLSTDFNFLDDFDFYNAYAGRRQVNEERMLNSAGFKKRTAYGDITVEKGSLLNRETLRHEKRHVKFEKIMRPKWVDLKLAPAELERLHRLKPENVDKEIRSIMLPRLREIIENYAKDEILAYQGFEWEYLIEKGERALYDYTFYLRQEIMDSLPKDQIVRDTAQLTLDNLMRKYDFVLENMADITRYDYTDKHVNGLITTPFSDWYKLAPSDFKKSDFWI